MTIQEILKQLREAEKVTTKDWELPSESHWDECYGEVKHLSDSVSVWGTSDNWTEEAEANASLIVLMRNNLIPLLDYIKQLEQDSKTKDLSYKIPK